MLAKIIALGLILILVVSTVILQMAIFGNYEEMEELEYDEYQIRINYEKMTTGIIGLFAMFLRLSYDSIMFGSVRGILSVGRVKVKTLPLGSLSVTQIFP